MSILQLMIKPASGNCNLRCKYCFYMDEMEKREIANYGFMKEETLEVLVKKALNYVTDGCSFVFQGGEPTLVGISYFEKLIEFVKKYNTKQVPISYAIQLNGYKLEEKWAAFFAKHHFLVGLSVDGISHTHNAYRVNSLGEATFNDVIKTAELFDRYGVEYNILTVVTNRTADRISRIYESYKKRGWRYQQYIACLDPMGEPRGSQEYSLTPVQYGEFLKRLFELWYVDFQKGEQPYIRLFENYIGILLGREPEACDQRGHCGIEFVVEADGSVYPCDFYVTDQYYLGNIEKQPISKLLERGKEIHFVEPSFIQANECTACEYAFICRGGCRRNREEDGEQLGLNYFCESYKVFFEFALPKMQKIAEVLRRI